MQGVTESLAGRAAVLHLLPLAQAESPKVNLFHGGFPEVLARPAGRELWFSSYLQTYLERDVRAVTQVRDLATFRRFLTVLASRHGQVLNKTDLAAPLGVSVPTIGQWLGVLETTGLVALIPPYFENFGKRLLKSPASRGPGRGCTTAGGVGGTDRGGVSFSPGKSGRLQLSTVFAGRVRNASRLVPALWERCPRAIDRAFGSSHHAGLSAVGKVPGRPLAELLQLPATTRHKSRKGIQAIKPGSTPRRQFVWSVCFVGPTPKTCRPWAA